MTQTDHENYDDIKDLQDEKYKILTDINGIDEKLNKLNEEFISIKDDLKSKAVEASIANDVKKNVRKWQHECKKCDAKFHGREHFNHHINTKHPKEITCTIYDLPFSQNHSLESHMESVHKKEKRLQM